MVPAFYIDGFNEQYIISNEISAIVAFVSHTDDVRLFTASQLGAVKVNPAFDSLAERSNKDLR